MADDEMAVTDEMAVPTEDQAPGLEQADSEAGPPAKKGFFSTTAGKVVLIGAAVSALLVIAGVVFFLVTTFIFVDQAAEEIQSGLEGAAQQAQEQPAEGAQGGTAAPAGEEGVAPGEEYSHKDVDLTDVHVWRDIFQPLLTPMPPEDETGGTSGAGGSTGTTQTAGSQYAADTLYLLDILTGSTETAAQFYYNGIDYNTTTEFATRDYIVVMEGERLADTPWRLLSIGVTSVTLQYGDSTVTLSVGQGIRK